MVLRICCLFLCLQASLAYAAVLHVGSGQPYETFPEAMNTVQPGDTILIHAGTYPGGLYFENIQGTVLQPILIRAFENEEVLFEGGNNAWQFTDAAHLHLFGITFLHQTGNGVNFDDGGSYDTPAHDIVFEQCTFRDMNASGNNDLLKLSGLDNFEIIGCTFLNGAGGGSGIDMVGCHEGVIRNCTFENMGSNAIQAKGGTRAIRIEANFFRNCGQRTLNLGGSTGLEFFRPIDAPYEAAELSVYANIFIGSVAPIAFVGCIASEVVNNTIYHPENWVLRILQETVDTTRFAKCGNNRFINNLMLVDNDLNVACNIGPNTAPETFTFSNNLWYHMDNPGWVPNLPVTDIDAVNGEDPILAYPENGDFLPQPGSPAIYSGLDVGAPQADFYGAPFAIPRSVGAVEGAEISGVRTKQPARLQVYPNPAGDFLFIASEERIEGPIYLFDTSGQLRRMWDVNSSNLLSLSGLEPGHYTLNCGSVTHGFVQTVIIW